MSIQENQSLNDTILSLTEENLFLKKHVEYLSNLQSIKIQSENQINSQTTVNCLLRDTVKAQHNEFIAAKDQSLQDYYLELIQKLRNNAVELQRISIEDCKKQNNIQQLQIELRCNYIDFVDKYQKPYVCYLTEKLEKLMTELEINSNELINVNNNYQKLLIENLNFKSQLSSNKKTIDEMSQIIQQFRKTLIEQETELENIRPTRRQCGSGETRQNLQRLNDFQQEMLDRQQRQLDLYLKLNENLNQENQVLKLSTQNNDIQNNEVGISLQNLQLIQSQLNEKIEQIQVIFNQQSQQQSDIFILKNREQELNETILQLQNKKKQYKLEKCKYQQDLKNIQIELDSAIAEKDIQIKENLNLNVQLMNLKQQNQRHEKNIFQNCQKIHQSENNIQELNNLIIKYECEIQQVKANNSNLNTFKTIQE